MGEREGGRERQGERHGERVCPLKFYVFQISRRPVSKKSPKNSEKVLVVSGYFQLCEKQSFSLSDLRCKSDATTSTKLKQTGEILWDSRCCLSAWVPAF